MLVIDVTFHTIFARLGAEFILGLSLASREADLAVAYNMTGCV